MSATSREVTDVIVVGSGPNGLAAAVTMARAGLGVVVLEAEETIGGGARTLDLHLAEGLRHDICSAVHPLAMASPFLSAFDLATRGVELITPELSYAHPLDGGRAGLAWRDLDRTATALEDDGPAWTRTFAPLVRDVEATVGISLADMRSLPQPLRSPNGLRGALAFGARVALHGTPLWNLPFRGDVAPAMLTGVAGHASAALPALAPAGVALMLGTLAHTHGWPIPLGGSQAITNALVDDLYAHGGEIRTGVRVRSWRELPRARSYLLDTSPLAASRIWRDRLPTRVERFLSRAPRGSGAAKVDFVLNGPVPWRVPEIGKAFTVHVGGSRQEIAAAEAEVARGNLPQRPSVLLSDPSVADPSREWNGLRPLWTYAHVPAGCEVDMTEAVTRQIERFAPGFRDVVVTSRSVPAARMVEHNANLVGGDISGGAVTMRRVLGGPTGHWDPYWLGIPGVYLCSSSTPPAPGVHGMNGFHAARRALAHRFGLRPPSLAPTHTGRTRPRSPETDRVEEQRTQKVPQ